MRHCPTAARPSGGHHVPVGRGLLPFVADAFEAAGAVTMVLGWAIASVMAFRDRGLGMKALVSTFRHGLGRGIMLGLEFMVGADILRTVGHNLDLTDLVNLGVLVLIRTFLSFTFEVELEGRWPWQTKPAPRRPVQRSE
jgi:uncharacterized membrane protein